MIDTSNIPHDEAEELLPWYVTGRLDAADRERVEMHLTDCPRCQAELRRRETLYGEFINEVSRLTADAFEHSLERPDTLVTVYAIAGRIHLLASAPVMKLADECCRYIVDLYSRPNMTIEEIRSALQVSEHPLRIFEAACRAELNQYVIQ